MVHPTAEPQFYRPAAGIAVFNDLGQIWLGRRKGQKGAHVWQLPQGGIDPNEVPEKAAYRELYEETGITESSAVMIGRIYDELFYDFPPKYRRRGKVRSWRGQRQSWFAVRFTGNEKHIDLKAHPPQEFSEWKWGNLADIPDLVIPFKRKVYERVTLEFAGFAKPVK